MWGSLIFDNYYAKNFFTYFLYKKEYLLLNILVWQYWWWFWFFFLIIFYYLLLTKVALTKRQSFFMKLASTKKAHGRWGDLLSGLIPLFWCFNILLNSNFLLKLNEWQTENNLFTLRIRGKQWYWVYKMNVFANQEIKDLLSRFGSNNKSVLRDHIDYSRGKTLNNHWRTVFYKKTHLFSDYIEFS